MVRDSLSPLFRRKNRKDLCSKKGKERDLLQFFEMLIEKRNRGGGEGSVTIQKNSFLGKETRAPLRGRKRIALTALKRLAALREEGRCPQCRRLDWERGEPEIQPLGYQKNLQSGECCLVSSSKILYILNQWRVRGRGD